MSIASPYLFATFAGPNGESCTGHTRDPEIFRDVLLHVTKKQSQRLRGDILGRNAEVEITAGEYPQAAACLDESTSKGRLASQVADQVIAEAITPIAVQLQGDGFGSSDIVAAKVAEHLRVKSVALSITHTSELGMAHVILED